MSESLEVQQAERRRIASGLVEMLALRDPDTGSHLTAVGALSVRLAKQLNLASDVVIDIELAGWMHDLGKHLLPFDLIAKPAALTIDEWAQMKMHPELGARLIAGFAPLAHLADAVRWHHERMDGTGYPDGLSGDQIPLASRIIAIADAFHAMTVVRPYCDPRSAYDALEEIARCAGSQFDERLVAVFIDMLQNRRSRHVDARSAV